MILTQLGERDGLGDCDPCADAGCGVRALDRVAVPERRGTNVISTSDSTLSQRLHIRTGYTGLPS